MIAACGDLGPVHRRAPCSEKERDEHPGTSVRSANTCSNTTSDPNSEQPSAVDEDDSGDSRGSWGGGAPPRARRPSYGPGVLLLSPPDDEDPAGVTVFAGYEEDRRGGDGAAAGAPSRSQSHRPLSAGRSRREA
eukprot:3049849-Pyramimonas_sp.AAC.1